MEQIIRGAEQAGVKVTIVDFANEERFVAGLRIDTRLSSTQGDKVRYFIHEHVDVCIDGSGVEYLPGSILVIWKNMMKASCSPRPWNTGNDTLVTKCVTSVTPATKQK